MTNKMSKLKTIGYMIVFFDKYEKWFSSDENELFVKTLWSEHCHCLQSDIKNIYDIATQYINSFRKKNKDDDWRCTDSNYLENLKNHLEYYKEFNQKIPIVFENDVFYIIRFGLDSYIVPKIAWSCFKVQKLLDYDNYSVGSLKLLKSAFNESLTVSNNLPAVITKSAAESKQRQIQDKLSEIKQRCDDIKEGKVKEVEDLTTQIEKLKAELEEKKQAMLSVMQTKLAEMEIMQKQMEQQIYQLDSEIYSIRCFFGEVVTFAKIRSGISCSEKEPVVLYQKLRYLDEEMGKIVNFYNIDAEELTMFEKLIASRDDVFTTFLPAQKSIALVRLSKDSIIFAASEKYHNMLEAYRREHGNMIGILIRDGENLYIGWTDDERINVQEDMFYAPSERTITPVNEEDVKKIIDKETQDSNMEAMVSRYFIFSVLQGILAENYKDRMINIPPKTNLLAPNEYVIYSTMDGWIEDNRFGTAADIIDKCNSQINLGDDIICCLNLYPWHSNGGYQAYNNDRGIGDKNRTHDVATRDKTVYPINLINYEDTRVKFKRKPTQEEIDYTEPENKYYSRCIKHHEPDDIVDGEWLFNQKSTMSSWKDEFYQNLHRWNYELVGEPEITDIQTHYYISLCKDDSDYIYNGGRYTKRQRVSKANFEVYKSEFINIQIMNTEWIKYLLITKKIGDVRIGGKTINYNHLIPYLNNIMENVKIREAEEFDLISQYVDLTKYTDWNVTLSDWKLKTGHHNIGIKYAKQFAKSLLKNNKE